LKIFFSAGIFNLHQSLKRLVEIIPAGSEKAVTVDDNPGMILQGRRHRVA
jgi:hypothetical protein